MAKRQNAKRAQDSDKQKATLAKNAMKPGETRNPAGRKPNPPEVKEFMRERSLEAMTKMWNLADDPETPARVKFQIWSYCVDPFVAKAATQVDVNHQLGISELFIEAARNRGLLVAPAEFIEAEGVEIGRDAD